jgi:four helix bundle protein
MAQSYRDLLVWQKGIELTKVIYRLTRGRSFPGDERFGLVAQLRRAAVSVPSNIAEGQARKGTVEFVHFLYVAKGSLAELDTQCRIASELNYLTNAEYEDMLAKIEELQRMIFALIRKLNERKP